MDMVSVTICDHRHIVQQRDLLPDVNGDVRRLNWSKYDNLDLALPNRFWIFSNGCHEEDCPCNICACCYVLGNGDSYSRLPAMLIYWFG